MITTHVDAIGNLTKLSVQLCLLIISRPLQLLAFITSYCVQACGHWGPDLAWWKFPPQQRVTSGDGLLPHTL